MELYLLFDGYQNGALFAVCWRIEEWGSTCWLTDRRMELYLLFVAG
jgi:hypothetical protein